MFTRKYFRFGDVGINNYNALIAIINSEAHTSAHIADLAKMLFKKHQYDAIFWIDYDPIHEPSPTIDPMAKPVVYYEWANRISYLFDGCYERYEALLAAYDSYKTHLMDKLTSKSTSKFNDTPQTTATGLDADGYASTYTVNNNEVDYVVIERLNMIEKLYADLYKDWCKEFEGVFIEVDD